MMSTRKCHSTQPAQRFSKMRSCRRYGYVLLETVIATGLLIVGLAVIGAQVQDSVTSVRRMDTKTRAMMLADIQLAELSLGLIELDSVDEVQEEEFGPRYPDFGWRLTIQDTGIAEIFHLTLEVLYQPREEFEDEFNFDTAEVAHTVYTLRLAPRPLDLGLAFGIPDEEFEELSQKLTEAGVAGLDAAAFDPAILAKLPFEDLIEVLPLLLDAFGIDVEQFASQLSPEIMESIRSSGLLDDEGTGEGADGGGP